MSATAIAAAQATAPSAATATAPPSSRAWKDGKSFGFHDFLDLINPLQHLPIIGSIYRWATGDEPGEVARVAGDTLYGGPIGLALGLVATATEDNKGRDLGERMLAGLFGSGDDGKTPSPTPATATASAAPPAASAQNAAWLSAFPDAAKNAVMPSPAKVAALYSSSPPAQAMASPAQSQTAASPVLDHPPMPLFRKRSAPAAADPAATDQNPASRAFLQRTAMLQRQISAGRNTDAPQLNNHPVPLQLSGGLILPSESTRPQTAPATPAAGQASSPVAVAPSQFSQKMLDALDKYRQLQQQLDRQSAADSVPGGAGLAP